MGWFEEQIKYRKKKDNEKFEDSLNVIGSAVMGKILTYSLDSKKIAHSAIEEILKYYHFKISDDKLPDEVKTLDDQLEYYLRPHGILRRSVELDEGWYKDATGPMIGTLKEDDLAISLMPRKTGGYDYFNFKTGERVKVNKSNEKLINREAVCFYKPFSSNKLSLIDLWKMAIKLLTISDILIFFGLLLVVTLLGMGMPIFTKILFSSVYRSGSDKVLYAMVIFMVCFTFMKLAVNAMQALVGYRMMTKQNVGVTAAIMGRLISLPVNFFKEYTSGEITQWVTYLQQVCSIATMNILTFGIQCIFVVIYVVQIKMYAESLMFPSFIIFLLMVMLVFFTLRYQENINRQKMRIASKNNGMTYSMVTGIQKIKLAGAEKRMFARWANKYSEEAKLEYNPPTFLKLSTAIFMTITLIGQVFLYEIAWRNNISPDDYFAFNTAYTLMMAAFTMFFPFVTQVASYRPMIEMIKPILETVPEVSERKEIVTDLMGNIELSNVSFRYNDDMPYVIDDVSLSIRIGEYVAIVGSTGCGKSTLIRLLLGFEKPQKGNIYYDRKDIEQVDLKSLRKCIGAVLQNDKLFAGDIFSNIVISSPHLTLDDAWEAAKIASVDKDIDEMPMGMHTYISDGQGGISGGQKQRILIARAVANKPSILIFDEATSALDNVTQKSVTDALDRLHCTRIVVAHRLSTIQRCDRIIVFDKGKIVEEGKYEELIDKKGHFYELVERQRLEYKEK